MKIALTLLIPLSLLLASCNATEIERLEAENKELREQQKEKSASINTFVADLNEISDGIRSIAIREDLLLGMAIDDTELAKTPEERINDDLTLIDGLIAENREKLVQMEKKLNNERGEVKEFKRIVSNLKKDLEDKQNSITILRGEIAELEGDYEMLLSDYYDQMLMSRLQEQELASQDLDMNTAWFAYGTKKEMEQMEVLEKVGGVLGIGRTHKLRKDFNKEYFTEVDIRTLEAIPLESDKVELVSTHPTESFEFVKEGSRIKELKITDPQKFWSSSKYLAMVVK